MTTGAQKDAYVIRAERLRFAYPPLSPDALAPWVIRDVELSIGRGEWLAAMGASDSGKTTLCLLLSGLAPHLTGGRMEGRVVVAGQDTREFHPPALADRVGILFQEPEAQLFNPTVESEVAWGLENLGLPVHEIRARVDDMLALLGLDYVRFRAPSQLSGGEKKRLALASVLVMRPSILILDEPLGGLDPAGCRDILHALSILRRQEPRVTIVMTESDPEAVAAYADRLVILLQGRIVHEGTPRTLFQRTDELAALGVQVPQLAQLAASLTRRIGFRHDFLTEEEAVSALAVRLA